MSMCCKSNKILPLYVDSTDTSTVTPKHTLLSGLYERGITLGACTYRRLSLAWRNEHDQGDLCTLIYIGQN